MSAIGGFALKAVVKTLADQFREALRDPDFYPSLLRWARRRSTLMRRWLDIERYAQDLVQAAIEGTLSGRLSWDSEKIPLGAHLRRAMRCQSRHDARHATHYPHEELLLRHGPVVDARNDESNDLDGRAEEAISTLRDLAPDDVDVTSILDAFGFGIFRRSAVLARTNLTPHRYKAARARMVRLFGRLPARLQAAVPKSHRPPIRKRGRMESRRPLPSGGG